MDTAEVLTWLERRGTRAARDGMARYGIVTQARVLGVTVGTMQSLAKRLKKELDPDTRHALAAGLWESGCYEGQMLAPMVDDPRLVTRTQMNEWARGFDNWATCDTACFHLFDRTPHAFGMVERWSVRKAEFVRRGAFALLASIALHDKASADEQFLKCLPMIERAATDERNFVKKGVSWALRGVGRRNAALHREAVALSQRLSESGNSAARWVGKDAFKELTGPVVMKRMAKVRQRTASPHGSTYHRRSSGIAPEG